MNATRRKAAQPELPTTATPRHFVNGTTEGSYVPTWTDTRPGAQDHENVPSRRAATREWRDGRVEKLA